METLLLYKRLLFVKLDQLSKNDFRTMEKDNKPLHLGKTKYFLFNYPQFHLTPEVTNNQLWYVSKMFCVTVNV